MKVQLPEALKSNMPQTIWGRILSATPVVMAVIATMLAGLASSEMTRAQYARSLAAQQQSKAGDQWSFFQAKRLRGAAQRNTLDLLQATVDMSPLSTERLKQSASQLPAQIDLAGAQIKETLQRASKERSDSAILQPPQKEMMEEYLQGLDGRKAQAEEVKSEMLALLGSADVVAALASMQRCELPDVSGNSTMEHKLKAALDAVESSRPEKETAIIVAQVDDNVLDDALRAARNRTQALDAATKPIGQAIDRVERLLVRQTTLLQEARAILLMGGVNSKITPSPYNDFVASRLRYVAGRYDAEAKLNQDIGKLCELQVRKSNQSAERHHSRSQRFFYGMLAAQLGVIVATFAIAARKRNLLWSLAAGAGLVAVGFGAYVYLFV